MASAPVSVRICGGCVPVGTSVWGWGGRMSPIPVTRQRKGRQWGPDCHEEQLQIALQGGAWATRKLDNPADACTHVPVNGFKALNGVPVSGQSLHSTFRKMSFLDC